MEYIAITQQTAEWMLGNKEVLEFVFSYLGDAQKVEMLKRGDVVEGPLRVAGSGDGRVVAIWNVDYLSGTGEELWGFVRTSNGCGVYDVGNVVMEVVERCLYVVNQRLSNLILEGSLIHETQENGTHICLSGRGAIARQLSVCYAEGDVAVGGISVKAVVCLGPGRDKKVLANSTANAFRGLSSFVEIASGLLMPTRRRPRLDDPDLVQLKGLLGLRAASSPLLVENVTVPFVMNGLSADDVYKTYDWNYDKWISSESMLSSVQRRILESDALRSHPLRIVGPAGSGKTLLMQLIALRMMWQAIENGENVKILYVVHNSAMAHSVTERFKVLVGGGGGDFYKYITISTLSAYGCKQLELPNDAVIDVDAHETKMFQAEQVRVSLVKAFAQNRDIVAASDTLRSAEADDRLFDLFSRLVMTEFSVAIKGHGLFENEKQYVESERRLSRLHGLLSPDERKVIFCAFKEYHRAVFDEYEVLDADDIALSLLGRMRTPIWGLKRRGLGFDFIFVDETQLFNENERRIFPLLARGNSRHVPIALALDEAQDVYSSVSAGFGALGIEFLASESLPSIHRSTQDIINLAFYVLQRTTDLFNSDFPDFTGITQAMVPKEHPLVDFPRIEVCNEEAKSFGRFVLKRVQELRKKQHRQVAVVVHSDMYWDEVQEGLAQYDLPLDVVLQRGDRVYHNGPRVVLTKPAYVGGQEFDAVIAVGIEQGLVPPKVVDNESFGVALEQQNLRELYLTFTRARYQLVILLNVGCVPSTIIQEAEQEGLIQRKH